MEEFKWHRHLILVHTVQLKPMIKLHSSGRKVSSGISDVVIASVHSEKTCLKKSMMMIMKNDSFWRSPETDFCHETEARKVMVDFKFNALYIGKSS